ncbi:hypothetical protein CDD83_5600 [Cordyceps sp. RAO-2017]|nr:hypothetical protein CDD83_5600 [Cordyceps sp. RAO-2017]
MSSSSPSSAASSPSVSADSDIGPARARQALARSETFRELVTFVDINARRRPVWATLVLVPVALVAGAVRLAPVAVFLLNLAAVVPLAAASFLLLLRLTRGAGIGGGLTLAVLGNAAELMVSIPGPPPILQESCGLSVS